MQYTNKYINKNTVKQESQKRNTLQQAKVVGYGQEVNGEETVNILLITGNSDSQTQQNTDVLKNVPIELSDGSSVKEALHEGDLVTVAFFEEDYSSPHIINSFSDGNRNINSSANMAFSADDASSVADFNLVEDLTLYDADKEIYGNQKITNSGRMVGDSSDESGYNNSINYSAGLAIAEQNSLDNKYGITDSWYYLFSEDPCFGPYQNQRLYKDGRGVHTDITREELVLSNEMIQEIESRTGNKIEERYHGVSKEHNLQRYFAEEIYHFFLGHYLKSVFYNGNECHIDTVLYKLEANGIINMFDAAAIMWLESDFGVEKKIDKIKDRSNKYINRMEVSNAVDKWCFIQRNPTSDYLLHLKDQYSTIDEAVYGQFKWLYDNWIKKGINSFYKLRFNKSPGPFSFDPEWPWQAAQRRELIVANMPSTYYFYK